MKALLCHQLGNLASVTIDEVTPPTPGPEEVLIGVRACSVNFSDVLLIEGKYQTRRDVPFSPGGEVAGDVLDVGARVTGLRAGDRVIAFPERGGMMEQAAVDQRRCIPMPASMDYRAGSAFLGTYGTALYALKTRAKLQPGETLVVLGAAGGAGLSAVSVGALMGARVIAAASSEQKVRLAEAHGAAAGIVYPRGPLDAEQRATLRDHLRELTSGGADVVYDPVGGDYTEPALRAIRRHGRLVVVGFAAGAIPRLPLNLLLLKNCNAIGVFYGDLWKCDPPEYHRQVAELLAWFEDGSLVPHVSDVFPLEQAPEALRALAERRAHGKVVIEITPSGAAP